MSKEENETATDTLPGTTVSAGAWSQFQQRMQLRREATCVAAIRRAMDGGDYPTALERANELAAIDPTWNEVKGFLEDVLAAAPGQAPPRQTRKLAAKNGAAAKMPRRHRTARALLIGALAVAGVTLATWTRALPIGLVGHWVAALGNQLANEILPSPVPPAPSPGDALAEVPQLPPADIVAPARPLPERNVAGNGSSQNGQVPGTAPPHQQPQPVLRAPAPEARERTPAPVPQQPERPGKPAPGKSAPGKPAPGDAAASSSSISPRPSQTISTPPPPLVSLDTAVQIQIPTAPQGTTDARAPENPAGSAGPPVPALPPVTPPVTESPPPNPPVTEARPETRVPAIGIGSPPDARATSGLAEHDADERAIDATLGAYAAGYTALNAAAVRRVWPTVNEEALGNAFDQLASQRIAFTGCSVDVRGLHASAMCRGTARYVPRVGNREAVSVSRVWQFSLRKRVDTWVIESVVSRQ